MPYYAVMSIQDSFNMFYGGVAIPFWLVILLSASIMIYFSITCALSTRTANIQNYIVTTVKFIPLLFAIIAGIGIFAMNHGHLPNPLWQTKAAMTDDSPKQFYQFSPVLGVVASVPAIFFAFDGFYSSSASQHKMHEPKRASQAMSLGIAVVAAVYILISIALLIGADGGSFFGLSIDTLKNAL
jgi:amino acid transporter